MCIYLSISEDNNRKTSYSLESSVMIDEHISVYISNILSRGSSKWILRSYRNPITDEDTEYTKIRYVYHKHPILSTWGGCQSSLSIIIIIKQSLVYMILGKFSHANDDRYCSTPDNLKITESYSPVTPKLFEQNNAKNGCENKHHWPNNSISGRCTPTFILNVPHENINDE